MFLGSSLVPTFVTVLFGFHDALYFAPAFLFHASCDIELFAFLRMSSIIFTLFRAPHLTDGFQCHFNLAALEILLCLWSCQRAVVLQISWTGKVFRLCPKNLVSLWCVQFWQHPFSQRCCCVGNKSQRLRMFTFFGLPTNASLFEGVAKVV